MAHEFVNGSAQKIYDLYKKVGEKIMELRVCYNEEANKKFEDDKALAWLLLVDGCAEKNKFKELDIKPDCVAFTQQNLFLLENQLPYCLLKWLMNWNGNECTLEGLIKSYIDKQAILTLPEDQLSVFLKLCPSSLSWNLAQRQKLQPEEEDHSSINSSSRYLSEISIDRSRDVDPIHLLDRLRTRLLSKQKK